MFSDLSNNCKSLKSGNSFFVDKIIDLRQFLTLLEYKSQFSRNNNCIGPFRGEKRSTGFAIRIRLPYFGQVLRNWKDGQRRFAFSFMVEGDIQECKSRCASSRLYFLSPIKKNTSRRLRICEISPLRP